MLNEEQKQLLLEVSISCQTLDQYHSDVATAYKDLHVYLQQAITNDKVSMEKNKLDNITYLVAFPLITMFEEMDSIKSDSPDYIYELVMYAYNTYKSRKSASLPQAEP